MVVHAATEAATTFGLDLAVELGALVLASIALLRPDRPRWFDLAMCWQLAVHAWELPAVANHSIMTALMALAWLVTRAVYRHDDAETAFHKVSPALRGLYLVTFAIAAFHKLNTGFLDPTTSCMTGGVDELLAPFTTARVSRAPVLGATLVWLAVGVELAVPVLLAVRRTWFWGVALAAGFHWLMAPGVVRFSAFGLAAMLLFVPWDRLGDATSVYDAELGRLTGGRLWLARCLRIHLAAFVGLSALLWGWGLIDAPGFKALYHFNATLWQLAVAPLLGLGLVLAVRRGWHRVSRARAPLAPWHIPLLLCMALHGMSPYLGLKTATALSMFSNLETEGVRSNHVWLGGQPLRWFGYQDDQVEVIDSSAPLLRRYIGERKVPFLVFRRHVEALALHRRRPVQVTYIRGGETFVVPDAGADPTLMHEPLWSRKFLNFRAPWAYDQRCPW